MPITAKCQNTHVQLFHRMRTLVCADAIHPAFITLIVPESHFNLTALICL